MKKFYFMSAALATMMAFAACNKTEVAPVAESEGALGLDEDIIEIAVSNTGIGTRAARPVLSSAADNNVNKVVLAFFDGTTKVDVTLTAVDGCQVDGTTLTYTDEDVEEGVPGDTYREVKTAKVKVSGLKDYESEELTIVAYGYNGNDFPYGEPTLKSGETYYEITSLGDKSGTSLEEVFAGNTTATVTANLGTAETPIHKFTSSVKIVLERQVAGMLAYFQNVPAKINDTQVAKITVEANGKSEGFYFPSTFLNTEENENAWNLNGINTKDKEVTPLEIDRVLESAKNILIPADREIIEAIEQEYSLDGQDEIKNPVGMSGTRLETKVHIITGLKHVSEHLRKTLNKMRFSGKDFIVNIRGSAEACLTEDEKELGVVVFDIGHSTTSMMVYLEGSVWHTAVIPVGSQHITNDIAEGLRITIPSAEKLKKDHGFAFIDMVGEREIIEVPTASGQMRTIPKRVLTEIIQPRVEEIFSLCGKELSKMKYI